MPRLNVPPTKSSLLTLRRQLAFAEEGYDLLEQKRQILVLELMSRVRLARGIEADANEAMRRAYSRLKEALLDSGSAALRRAAVGALRDHHIEVTFQHLPGVQVPHLRIQISSPTGPITLAETTANADLARNAFIDSLAVLGRCAESRTSIERLARELQKTQRRCNALSRIFIPSYREAITYITAALEERELESFVILKMIRDRLRFE